MKLNLTKDITFLDLETTGLSVVKSKIIQIALLKIFADGRQNELKVKLLNPEITIPELITELTGITDEMVKGQPTFQQNAKGIANFIGRSDLVTFNGNRFDIPMLLENFSRSGVEFDMSGRRSIDVKRIFHKMEKRDLSAAYFKYTGKELEGAHDAGADVTATYEVLEAMLDCYKDVDYKDKDEVVEKPVKNDVQTLNDFTRNYDEIDYAGTMKWNENNVAIFNFGKYQGLPVAENFSKDRNYYDWVMYKGDFTSDTKKWITKIMEEHNEAKAFLNKP